MEDRVQSLWVGERLSTIERLSLQSFLSNGHRYRLYVYDEVQGVPDGVEIADANSVVPASQVFEYRRYGGFSGFSNWFRYALMLGEGNLWADTDMICLRRIDLPNECLYGRESAEFVSPALLRLSKGHDLARWMVRQCENPNRWLPYDDWRQRKRKLSRRFLRGNSREDIRWGELGPRGFTAAVRHFGMFELAQPEAAFYPIAHERWRSVFDGSFAGGLDTLEGSYTLHLWNEKARRDPRFDKDAEFPSGSLIEQLKRRYL
jgi:hypothetical protein